MRDRERLRMKTKTDCSWTTSKRTNGIKQTGTVWNGSVRNEALRARARITRIFSSSTINGQRKRKKKSKLYHSQHSRDLNFMMVRKKVFPFISISVIATSYHPHFFPLSLSPSTRFSINSLCSWRFKVALGQEKRRNKSKVWINKKSIYIQKAIHFAN